MVSTQPLSKFFARRIDGLLKPYFVCFVLLGLVKVLVQNQEAVAYFLGVLYANGGTIAWVPMWFLPHLFVVSLFGWFLVNALSIQSWPAPAQYGIITLLLVAGVLLLRMVHDALLSSPLSLPNPFGIQILPGLPFSVDLLLVSTAFYLAGYVLRERVRDISVGPLMLVVAAACFVELHVVFRASMDLNLRRYDHILITTMQALLGIYIVIAVSALIAKKGSRIANLLALIGANTMPILIFHTLFQDKVLTFLQARLDWPSFVNATVAFVVGCVAPFPVWKVVKGNRLLSGLMLPFSTIDKGAANARVPTRADRGNLR